MFAVLIRNTAVTAAAYLASAALNLMLVPLTIGAYGLHEYGLIMLARVLLPTGFMALLDLGVSETSTLVVARARETRLWQRAAGQILLLAVMSLSCGAVIGVSLWAFSPQLASWFQAGESSHSFIQLIRITGVALLVLFPGLLFEGVVKGYERYGLLRLAEVLTTLAYAIGTVIVIREGYTYAAVAYLFLGVSAIKYAVLAACAVTCLKHSSRSVAFQWPDTAARGEMWQRSILMLQNKTLGAMHTQAPPVFVGILVGPAGAGVYDVLTRLPRSAKSILSLLNSALLPLSARFEETSDRVRMRVLGATGLWLVPALTFPLLIGGAVFADDLLRVWLGPSLVHLWPWLSLMFIVPLLNILLSFGQTMMQVRSRFLEENNRLALASITMQFILSLALVRVLDERAFIAGQVASTMLVFPFQMRLLLREQELEADGIWRVFLRHAAVAMPLTVVALLAKHYALTERVIPLAIAFALWCAAYWVFAYAIALSASERVVVRKLIAAVVGDNVTWTRPRWL